MKPSAPLDLATTALHPPRRRLLVSLRGLMLLVLVIGGGIGWKVNKVRTQRLAVEAIQGVGGTVLYDYQFSIDQDTFLRLSKAKEPPGPEWLRHLFGDDFFQQVGAVNFPKAVPPEILGAVAKLDGLVSLQIGDTAGLEAGWPALARLSRLEQVWLVGSGVTDPALSTLAEIRSLRLIRLINAEITDSGIVELGKLSGLLSLWLGICPNLSDQGVARLLSSGLSSLEDFAWSRSSDSVSRVIQALATHHKNLRYLSFIQTPAQDADFAPIGALSELKVLNLQQTKVTDEGVAYLGPLRKLESLMINLPGVTDEAMTTVGGFHALKYLDLSWSKVGDLGLSKLSGLAKLTNLKLRETEVTDAGAESLAKLINLEILVLDHTKLTDVALGSLGKLGKLRMLSLGGVEVSTEGLIQFRTASPKTTVSTRVNQPKIGPLPVLK